MNNRSASISRDTRETRIALSLNIDGGGRANVSTTIPFMDEMLGLFARSGRYDLTVQAQGDTHIDDHHLVEDLGISLGEVLLKAVGDKKGITRYGNFLIPVDGTESYVALDLSNRSYFIWKVSCRDFRMGTFDGLLLEHFFESIASNARMNLHMAMKNGMPSELISENLFKGFGLALAQATAVDPRVKGVPSTKGCL